jgi:UDP-N-acetylglucosamine 2-epimerase (non-hydrolysing)/GDP/UDP-N,N'-diacetylbacillosamine 2-epimerase (hydrolysing)
MRRIAVVTGTRAEYGILLPVLKAIETIRELELALIVTGMHLSHEFGYTVKEIEDDGFRIHTKVEMLPSSDTPKAMAESIGVGIAGMAQAWEQLKPDIILVLGDRVEPLAAAIAGAFMNIPVAHIHGGDVSGNIDESIRHAITKFAHIHFPATAKSAERIFKMGEDKWRVHIVGPLGIYAMSQADLVPKEKLYKKLGLNPDEPLILVVQHPVTTQVESAPLQMRETMEALVELNEQAIVIYPNADAGGRGMIEVIKEYENYPFIKTFKNLPYLTFVSVLKVTSVMIGNSSSAIFESPLFGIPVINIGIRQIGRERGNNVIDIPHSKTEIIRAIRKALADEEFRKAVKGSVNPFDTERKGAQKIADIVSEIRIDEKLLQKRLIY